MRLAIVGFPDLPDVAHEIRTGLQNFFSGFPAGRTHFLAFGLAHVLKRLDLADGFSKLATHGRGEHFLSGQGLVYTVRDCMDPDFGVCR